MKLRKNFVLYDQNKLIEIFIGKTTILVYIIYWSFIDFNNSNMKLKMMELKIKEKYKILDFFQIHFGKHLLI